MTDAQLSRLAIRIASDATGVPGWAIRGPSKFRENVEARDFAIRLMANSGLTKERIAEAVNRDRSTVFYSLNKTKEAAQ